MNYQHKQATESKQGFTIIEVVLVLAIAGLIFLMVFLALPALQRSQRDTQRKDDLSRINTQISNYQSSNRGAIPSDGTSDFGSFVAKYLKGAGLRADADEYADPTTGEGYLFNVSVAPTEAINEPSQGTIYYKATAKCGNDGEIETGSGRQYALRIPLEGQSSLYCIDNV
jgi:prepilin-type N-terminal cleavage/methylation domain-containing protein